MNFLELLIIAIGLSMDAFAVSVCIGLGMKKPQVKDYLAAGLYFGIFQALMPLIGYLIGVQFAARITSADHWVAFVLLVLIGGHMIWESRSEAAESYTSTNFTRMLTLAIATSIDALAVGVSFAFLKVSIIGAVVFIGVTTLVLSMLGVRIGQLFGSRFKAKAELAGGVILILVGLKILVEHLLG
jgi:putative Mn2+ efflux pump MntP